MAMSAYPPERVYTPSYQQPLYPPASPQTPQMGTTYGPPPSPGPQMQMAYAPYPMQQQQQQEQIFAPHPQHGYPTAAQQVAFEYRGDPSAEHLNHLPSPHDEDAYGGM
jgi:hypothetical protein